MSEKHINPYWSVEFLTERLQTIQTIIRLVEETDLSQAEIGKKFGLDRETISRILSWNNIKVDPRRISKNRLLKLAVEKERKISELKEAKIQSFILDNGTIEKHYVKFCEDNGIDPFQKEISDLGENYDKVIDEIKSVTGDGPFVYDYFRKHSDYKITKQLAYYMCKSIGKVIIKRNDSNSKFNCELLAKCSKLYSEGYSTSDIATIVGVNPKCLCNAFVTNYGKDWKKIFRSQR